MVLEDRTGSVPSVLFVTSGVEGGGRRQLDIEVWSSDKRSGLDIEI